MRSVRARLFVGLSVLVVGTNIGFGLLSYRRAAESPRNSRTPSCTRSAVRSPGGRHGPRPDRRPGRTGVPRRHRGPGGRPSRLAPGGVPATPPTGSRRSGRVADGGGSWSERAGRQTRRNRPIDREPGRARQGHAPPDARSPVAAVALPAPAGRVIIQASFRPLSVLAGRLDARPPDDLRTLPAEGVRSSSCPSSMRSTGSSGASARWSSIAAASSPTPRTSFGPRHGADRPGGEPVAARHAGGGPSPLAALQGGIRRLGHLRTAFVPRPVRERHGGRHRRDVARRGGPGRGRRHDPRRRREVHRPRLQPQRAGGRQGGPDQPARDDPQPARQRAAAHAGGGRIDVEVYAEAGFAVFRRPTTARASRPTKSTASSIRSCAAATSRPRAQASAVHRPERRGGMRGLRRAREPDRPAPRPRGDRADPRRERGPIRFRRHP